MSVPVFVMVAAAAAGAAAAADDLDAARATLLEQKRGFIEDNLRLTPEEGARFWRAYDAYERDMNAVADRSVRVLNRLAREQGPLSDADARALVDDLVRVEEERAAVLRRHLAAFRKALPDRKVARFYQLESKVRAQWAFEAWREIPLVR